MVFWLKKPDGRCVKLTDRWKPRIHVGGDYDDLVHLACKPYVKQSRFVEKHERAGDLENSRVLEIEVDTDGGAAKLAHRIQRDDNYSRFRLYDVDVPSPQVYLYQKDLFPLAYVEAEEKDGHITWNLKDSREIIDFSQPPLRQVRLEVKTKRDGKIPKFTDKIGSIHIERVNNDSFEMDSETELDKILDLVYFFKREDPDVVFTKGGDSFIFPYLARRANENGILDKLIFGRDTAPLRVYEVQGHSYFSYGKILYRDTAARLLGRLHIDSNNAFISADCGLEGLFEISRTCIIPLQRASRATIGTNMTSLQLYHAVKKQVLIPWNKSQPETWNDHKAIVDADRGGFIYGPSTGIHDDVGEIDFTSLYPTIMRDKNLSGETVNCRCCPRSIDLVPETNYRICNQQNGIVAQSLDILLKRRLSYKRLESKHKLEEKFKQRQSALKWILVCSFGYLGFKNARFGKIDAHIATCAFSRQFIDEAVSLARKQGFEIVHGIVDSMWLSKPEATDEEYAQLAASLWNSIRIPLSFEGKYRWIVFLNSKTVNQVPVLNRYYGVFQDGKIKVRGIDLRRHDTPQIVRDCQDQIFSCLSKIKNTDELRDRTPQIIDIVRGFVDRLRNGDVPIESLAITRSLSKNPLEYSHKVPQAIAALHLRNNGGLVHEGQQVGFIFTADDAKKNQPTAIAAQLADDHTAYDQKRYVEILISSTANLFLPLGFDKQLLSTILTEN